MKSRPIQFGFWDDLPRSMRPVGFWRQILVSVGPSTWIILGYSMIFLPYAYFGITVFLPVAHAFQNVFGFNSWLYRMTQVIPPVPVVGIPIPETVLVDYKLAIFSAHVSNLLYQPPLAPVMNVLSALGPDFKVQTVFFWVFLIPPRYYKLVRERIAHIGVYFFARLMER